MKRISREREEMIKAVPAGEPELVPIQDADGNVNENEGTSQNKEK